MVEFPRGGVGGGGGAWGLGQLLQKLTVRLQLFIFLDLPLCYDHVTFISPTRGTPAQLVTITSRDTVGLRRLTNAKQDHLVNPSLRRKPNIREWR